MLALDLRRQSHHYRIDHPSPALQHPHLQFQQPHNQFIPSPTEFNSNNKTASGFFDSSSATVDSSSQNQYMTDAYSYANPAIRIQQSTPTPGLELPQVYTDTSSLNQWNAYSANNHMVATRPLQAAAINRNRTHQRAQSSSSMGSSSSGSPFTQGHAPYGYSVADSSPLSKPSHNFTNNHSSSGFSNHLPTPTQTPTSDSFLGTSYPAYSSNGEIHNAMAAHLVMNSAFDTHSIADEEIPGMSHSGRQSVSSMGQDPSTPRTNPEGYDDGFKVPTNVTDQSLRFPKLDRTVSDAYRDELYDPSIPMSGPSTQASKSNQYLAPHRTMINDYLQKAQMARSQSPTGSGSRGVSPFRPDSPYVQGAFGQMQRPITASTVRQAQQARASQVELSQHSQSQADAPKTISPKDAMLDYNESEEDAKMPLFTQNEASAFGQQQFNNGCQQDSQPAAAQNMGNQNASRAADWTNNRRRSNNPQSTNTASYNYGTPAIPNNFQGLPFSSQNYRPTNNTAMKKEDTPDFPAHLTSMESSASEAPPSSQNSLTQEIRKPASSTADSGTYTCTYHGCSLRFETPQRLQKHKREGHRNLSAPISSPGPQPPATIGSAMTSAALAQRNSQAGPHKCERINPTTGKPCNTIFSRPYDLTRHEDTIHNIRKQKVRCALCVEEKTFSRNDALTRHMRVVHPEVDFPGKHRRRGD